MEMTTTKRKSIIAALYAAWELEEESDDKFMAVVNAIMQQEGIEWFDLDGVREITTEVIVEENGKLLSGLRGDKRAEKIIQLINEDDFLRRASRHATSQEMFADETNCEISDLHFTALCEVLINFYNE